MIPGLCFGVLWVLIVAVQVARTWHAIRRDLPAAKWSALRDLARHDFGISPSYSWDADRLFEAMGEGVTRAVTGEATRPAAVAVARVYRVRVRWRWTRSRVYRAVGAAYAARRFGVFHVERTERPETATLH